jgi:acyl-CoA synthetase (AMP-forming)/AMP-acid ligase II
VGHPVPPNEVAVIEVSDESIEHLEDARQLPRGEIGEIIVHGPTTTDAYWHRDAQTRLAKIRDAQGRTWHRMGDIGWFDDAGRLWYCGRKSQRVKTADGTLYPDQVEAVFNTLPGIERTALVGVGDGEIKRPVLCVELPREQRGSAARSEVRARILELATARPELAGIQDVMFHRAFPVDIRHNAKIGREKLAVWATKKLS